jgi:hypothetical protein
MKGVNATDVVQFWYPEPEDQDKFLRTHDPSHMHHKKGGVLSMENVGFRIFYWCFIYCIHS